MDYFGHVIFEFQLCFVETAWLESVVCEIIVVSNFEKSLLGWGGELEANVSSGIFKFEMHSSEVERNHFLIEVASSDSALVAVAVVARAW